MKKSRMQQLAGIKTNLNESFFGGYVDMQPLKETDNSDLGEGFGDKLRSVGRFAGDMLGIGKDDLIDALFRQFDEYDIKNTKYGEQVYSDYINDRSAARPNFKSFFQTVDNLTIKAIAQELGVDFDDENNLRREGEEDMEEGFSSDAQRKAVWASKNEKNEGMEDMEEDDSMTGEEGWEANTLADYFSNSEKETQDIAKQLDFLLRENCQDDIDDIVDLIIELAQGYANERINTSDLERGTFDEAKEKKGEDAEKKEKDYKGMNMSKGDVLNKMGKGKTNTVKGDRAKSYVPPHARKNESSEKSGKDTEKKQSAHSKAADDKIDASQAKLDKTRYKSKFPDSLKESKIKPNSEFIW
jgi:hypothetical protein